MLFLDELPEFRRPALEALRMPLEDGEVLISRARRLGADARPLPGGGRDEPVSVRQPRRPPPRLPLPGRARLAAYRNRISGPLADRFDLRVAVPRADAHGEPGEPTAQVAARVAAAHALLARGDAGRGRRRRTAAGLGHRAAAAVGPRPRPGGRVAATIAALDGRTAVTADDVAEALSLRIELTR